MITSMETMATKVFLDSSYAIALAASSDQYHDEAKRLAQELKSSARLLITTRAVVLEIGNALSKLRYRKAGVRLLNSLENDPTVAIIPLSEQLYLRALALFQDRMDKNGASLIACPLW